MPDNKFIAGEVKELAGLVAYHGDSIVSRVLINKPSGNVTLFALAQGQSISEHTTPFDALVNVIEGEAEIIIAGNPHILQSGEVMIMPAHQPHALNARKKFKMVLTLIKQ